MTHSFISQCIDGREAEVEALRAERDQLRAENERLRYGISALIRFSPEHQPHPERKDKCVHERWDYDGYCDICVDEYLQRLLDGEVK